MQDIITAIIRNRNLLHKQFAVVESELDYLYLEGDEDSILEELDLIASELIKTSFVKLYSSPNHHRGDRGNSSLWHPTKGFNGVPRRPRNQWCTSPSEVLWISDRVARPCGRSHLHRFGYGQGRY